jgi:leader peptidase (prepilin peptidase) / N-methyltransferase
VLDAEHFWLPNALVLPLGVAGLALGVPPLTDRLIGAVAGYVVFEAIRVVYKAARGREGLGGGDSKLLGAIGAWLGWAALPFVVLGASATGIVWVLVTIARGQTVVATDRVPLGTLLAVAAYGIWIAGAEKVFY